MDDIEKLLKENTPASCPRCRNKLEYRGEGEYRCKACGHKVYDDYGKIMRYVNKNGTAPVHELSKATGVSEDIIDLLIQKGKFANPEDYVPEPKNTCLNCGRIVLGKERYCRECKRTMFNSIGNQLTNTTPLPDHNPMNMHFRRKK